MRRDSIDVLVETDSFEGIEEESVVVEEVAEEVDSNKEELRDEADELDFGEPRLTEPVSVISNVEIPDSSGSNLLVALNVGEAVRLAQGVLNPLDSKAL